MIINDLFNNKKTAVAEGRFVKGPGGVPLDRQGRPVAPKAPKAEPMTMRQWVVHHEGQRGEGGEMTVDAPNLETAWELANEYDLDIIDIKPAKGVSEGSKLARADKSAKAPKPKDQQEYDAVEKYRKDLAQSYNKEPNFGIKDDEEENKWWIDYDLDEGVAEGDGFDDVSNYADMRTTDTGNKSNQTYTSTTIQKNPATGQQKSLASWDHTDPKTGKNYSGTNYIDPQGNAEVQKNYEESKNKVNEVSLGDYRKKATMSKALAQTNKFFDRDNPAAVAAADQTIANRTKGLARADARIKPYTPPTAAPADLEKQQRDLTAKYPNIDELVRKAELNRDPDYEMADGQAYYAARDAEQNYQKLKQIQRVIQGLNESLNRSHLP